MTAVTVSYAVLSFAISLIFFIMIMLIMLSFSSSFFCAEPTSTLFAPSIIAISSLILSFSILKVDCSDWLSNMPNFCLLHSEIPNSAENVDSRYFDIDSCLQNFRNVEEDYPHYRDGTETPSRSPTRVVDGIDSPALSSSQNQIQNQKDRNTLKRKRSSYNLQEIFIDDAFLPLPTSDSYSNSTTNSTTNKRTFGVFSPLVLSQDVPVKFTTSLSVMMMNRGDTIVSEKSPFPGNDS